MVTVTAAQRRAQAKEAYDAFLSCCPSRQLLDMVANKWVCLVLTALAAGAMRHSELQRRIAGVSQKMLTQTLRELERDGLVSRQVTASVPVRVDYELTELGHGLRQVLQPLKDWAEANMARVMAHRASRPDPIASSLA